MKFCKLEKYELIDQLIRNVNLFAWTPSYISGIDTRVVPHFLVVNPSSKLVAQRKKKVGEEKRTTIDEEVGKLSNVWFITEKKYPTWFANMVLVRKAVNKCRICLDFTDLNTVCPKDPYPLPDIDRLIDGSTSYRILNIIDAYSGYNQMKMNPLDASKTTYMSNHDNYYYNSACQWTTRRH